MVKRVAAAALFLIFAAAASFFSSRYIRFEADEITCLVDFLLENEAGQTDFLQKKDELLKKWRENETFFGMLLSHNDFDELEKIFIFLSSVHLPDDAQAAEEKLRELKGDIAVAVNGEKLLWENIF